MLHERNSCKSFSWVVAAEKNSESGWKDISCFFLSSFLSSAFYARLSRTGIFAEFFLISMFLCSQFSSSWSHKTARPFYASAILISLRLECFWDERPWRVPCRRQKLNVHNLHKTFMKFRNWKSLHWFVFLQSNGSCGNNIYSIHKFLVRNELRWNLHWNQKVKFDTKI